MKNGEHICAYISARGVVQGVGFRPFVYLLATRHSLAGWVCNTSEDVKIEVEGSPGSVDQFCLDLQKEAPPLSRIEAITIKLGQPKGYTSFDIRPSIAAESQYQLISPDIATCPSCLDEILDTKDRRYRYPFTNCTNCGPRFTIIKDIPYDRARTTMNCFTMCPKCQDEYNNPLDRRFHAQPNACPACGPQMELLDRQGNKQEVTDIIITASKLLKDGKIVALKGLGGFLLACDATNHNAVMQLRRRKNRPSKPFAIMVADLVEARRHCSLSAPEEELLASPQCPVVLVTKKESSTICPITAPNLKHLGLMLPYTPLHHILLRDTGLPLVMTSGNLSEEPIAKDNDEAVRRLAGIADFFLVHNRDIYARYDDSVTRIEQNEIQLLRRARGYAPYPVHLSFNARQVLGCGAEEKNTFCLTRDNYAFLSQHIGDMENVETLEHFENTISLYQKLFRIEPEIIACDLHPEYLSTKYAQAIAEQAGSVKLVAAQHHHAHIVSCMADNGIDVPVIGVALDGTGYGSDGHIWGGEFIIADYKGFQRQGHLEYLPLPGGDTAIKRPYRIAIAYLLKLLGSNSINANLEFLKTIHADEISAISHQVETGLNSPQTSSMGRLFDAVSALSGIRGTIDYEAQAAIEMEIAALEQIRSIGTQDYPCTIAEQKGIHIIQLGELFSGIVADLLHSISAGTIAAKFHNTLAKVICEMCQHIEKQTGITRVALSGGVFQNRLLLRIVIPSLEAAGFTVLTHKQVPCNDGGISLGQAVIANFS